MNTNLSSEQLAKIINDEPDIETIRLDHSNVYDFIKDLNIEQGNTRVPNFKIYHDYCKGWMPTGQKISKIGFFRKFKKAFKQKRIGSIRYYLVKEGIFDTSPESIEEAQIFDSRYRKRVSNGTVGNGKRKGQKKKGNKEIES